MSAPDYASNAYIGRAIAAGVRRKKAAPFEAPARARLKNAIAKLYDATPGALVSAIPGERSAGRNALFDVRFLLLDGSTTFDFPVASKAMQAGQPVRVQLWECTKVPTPFPASLFEKDAHDGEFVMRAEKSVALTASEFERHSR